MEKILLDFGINGRIKKINNGPVVSLYEFEPAAGVKVSKIINLSDDIAESNDVSAENSQVLERLVAAWGAYAKQNGVFVPGPPQQKSE